MGLQAGLPFLSLPLILPTNNSVLLLTHFVLQAGCSFCFFYISTKYLLCINQNGKEGRVCVSLKINGNLNYWDLGEEGEGIKK